MKQIPLIAAVLCLMVGAARAEDYSVGKLEIANPWLRATPKGAEIAGGYMTIRNKGDAPDRLIGGTSDVAGRFELHQMTMEQNVMKMRPVEGGLEIKPGAAVEFTPGSLHIMLVGLKHPLEKGQRVKGTLVFEKAGKVDVEYSVEAMGATDASVPAGGMDHMHH
jgi:copper(I)-binding protein